jgi:hypothetical protein
VAFQITRRTPLDAQAAWARLTDWEAHSELIPFTTVTRSPGPRAGVGSGFVAHTSIGVLGFDDPMEVTFWQPPTGASAGDSRQEPAVGPAGDTAGGTAGDTVAVCRIVKTGRVVVGWAVLTVTPDPSRGSTVTWLEEADIRRGGPLLRRLNELVGRYVFGRVLERLVS